MRKTVLLSAALAMATTGFAQEAVAPRLDAALVNQIQVANAKMAKADENAQLNVKAKAPARAAADGVYYARPAGTFYTTSNNQGYGYYCNYLLVPPYADLTWTNMSTNKAATSWTINGQDASDYVENYNYIGSTYGHNGYVSYEPVLTDGTTSYQLGESGKYFSTKGPGYTYVSKATYMSYYDNCTTVGSYGFGGLDNYNLFGTGNVTVQGTTYASYGTLEIFPAPAAPLYVDTIRVTSMGQQAEAIPAGTTVNLTVYGVTQDEDGFDAPDYKKVLGQFTCTSDDVSNWYEMDYSSYGYGMRYYDYLFFTQKTTGPFGNEVTEPIVLNEKFAIAITGLSQTGVDVNILGVEECAEDSVMEGAAMLITDGTDKYTYWRYGTGMTQNIDFHGVFDYVEPLDVAYSYDEEGNQTGKYENFNVLTVPATGVTDGSQEGCGVVNKGSEDLYYTEAVTAFSWEDEEGNDNYDFIDTPDWLQLGAEAYDGTYTNYGIIYVASADALPSGTTGRAASIYLEGKGYQSKTPVIILQGDATIADAIANPVYVKANATNKTYNINGQEVGKNFKGIVIKDGKKSIQK